MAFQDLDLAFPGVLAAGLLVGACGSGDDLHAATVRGLAGDLGRRLSALSDSPVEAALVCADLATLAACNVRSLQDGPSAMAATHLAAGAARALVALVESGYEGPRDAHAENVLRDLRSAGWKADLAVGQLSNA